MGHGAVSVKQTIHHSSLFFTLLPPPPPPPPPLPRHCRRRRRRWLRRYPKVQKYCLMSVGGCFTDFHIDFGGSSVWYHVLRGVKIFFLIAPSPENIKRFEKWSRESQGSKFFGDSCPGCTMVTLTAGHTFLIPTGWIHAVYTPEDSLVFGGNFLHGFNITGQLGMAKLESRLKVPNQYRFPFFQELMWYAAMHYGERLQRRLADEKDGFSGKIVATSPYEADGLAKLLPQLQIWAESPLFSKHIPKDIPSPAALMKELEGAVEQTRVSFQRRQPTGPTEYYGGVKSGSGSASGSGSGSGSRSGSGPAVGGYQLTGSPGRALKLRLSPSKAAGTGIPGPGRGYSNKPMKKRTPSAFLLYIAAMRDTIKTMFPDVQSTQIMSKAAELWKALPGDESKEYHDQAAKLRDAAPLVNYGMLKAEKLAAQAARRPPSMLAGGGGGALLGYDLSCSPSKDFFGAAPPYAT